MSKPRSVTVTMRYPGSVISANHYKGRRREGGEYIKAGARTWMEGLGWLIKGQHIEGWRLPLKITVSGTFRDLRGCPDIHNLLKCICDAVQQVTGLNDGDYKTETAEPRINRTKKPELNISIEESVYRRSHGTRES